MKHTRRFTALTALLLCAVLLFTCVSAAFAEENVDWDKWEKKARKVLEAEGHDLSDIIRTDYLYADKNRTGDETEYCIYFYNTRKGDDCKCFVSFNAEGRLWTMEKWPSGKGRTYIDDPTSADVDRDLLKKAKKAIKAFLKKYSKKGLVSVVDRLYVAQIANQGDIIDYTFTDEDALAMYRVRVAPYVRMEYFTDQR